MKSTPPSVEAPYSEAANWFARIQQRSLSPSEWASFGNWFNFSRWNRLAFEQVGKVWQGAPGCVDPERSADTATPPRFSWHHADAWRTAVLPLAMNWYLPGDDATRERQFLPVRAAAAPAGLL